MGVKITGIRFNNDFRTSQDLDFLLSCIGEKVAIEVDFEYQDIIFASTVLNKENTIEFEPVNSTVNIADITGIIESEDGAAFTDYYVGDSVKVHDVGAATYTSYTVTEKIDNGIIRVDASLGTKVLANNSYVYNTTPFAGLRYAYNLIDAGASFNSLIDGEYQQGESDQVDATVLTNKTVYFTGEKSYQIGSMLIKGRGTEGLQGATGGGNDDIKQLFTLTHNTVITPFFLANQYQNLLNGVKPFYFDAQNTLNYIGQLSLGRDLSNPNKLQTLIATSNKSNVGWFNERFNGGRNNYSVSSLILTDVTSASTINELQFGREITVDIIIDNTTDSPFSDTNTNYTFGFNYLPEDSDLYDKNKDANGNGYDQTRNFAFDSKSNVLGNGSVNGDNFGNPLQIIKSVTSTFISSTQMKVTATIETGTDADAILQQGDFDRYQFWVITENHALTAAKSDKVNLLVSVNEFYVQQAVSNPIISGLGTTLIEHPYTDKEDGVDPAKINIFPVDDPVANTDFFIDYSPAASSPGQKAQWRISLSFIRATLDAQVVINENSTTIGTANWQGTELATAQELADSINTNTNLGTVFSPNYPFDNSLGWTAVVGVPAAPNAHFGVQLIIFSPAEDSVYNSFMPQFYSGTATGTTPRIVDAVDSINTVSAVGATIENIQSRLILRDLNNVEADIVLEDFNFSTSNYPLVSGVQDINFSQDRVFKIPAEIRKTISCYRDFASDNGDLRYFTHQYPFMHRWEYWVQLITTGTIPAELFDNTLDHNGINQFWHRYTTIANWQLAYQIIFTVEQNSVQAKQTFTQNINDSRDFDGNPNFTNNSIKSYDLSGFELLSGTERFIKGYEDVRVEAIFNKTAGTVAAADQFGIVFWIETYEKGGIPDIRRMSSFYEKSANSWFKSTDASNKVVISKNGTEFKGECLIDNSMLPADQEFSVYARYYQFEGGEAKQFMNDDDFDFMDGTSYDFM